MAHHRDTIVVGASSDGIAAPRRQLGALPADLAAAALIVLHQGRTAGRPDAVLRPVSPFPPDFVAAPRPLESGRVCVAPPDMHMIVADAENHGTSVVHEYRRRAEEAMTHSENARRFLLSLQSESSLGRGDEAEAVVGA